VARNKAKKRNSLLIRTISSPAEIDAKYETAPGSSWMTALAGENSTALARPEKTLPFGVTSSTKTSSARRVGLGARDLFLVELTPLHNPGRRQNRYASHRKDRAFLPI
jgi:hypothetical protein